MAAKMQSYWKKVIDLKMPVDDLLLHKDEFLLVANKLIGGRAIDDREVEAFLRLCLDVYAFSESGQILIPDRMYDMCMNIWRENHETIIYADTILTVGQGRWDIKKHEIPGLVGTLPKIYTYDELKVYFEYLRDRGCERVILSPKYDGISVVVTIKDGRVIMALTRYKIDSGQDITLGLQYVQFDPAFYTGPNKTFKDGIYKCEATVTTSSFNDLQKVKPYANRRSAVSGILSSPKNTDLGRFVTLVPLLYYHGGTTDYMPPGSTIHYLNHPRDLESAIENFLKRIRVPEFPYRVDGVVMYPISKVFLRNEADYMEGAMAYKVNTAEATTTIEYVYMSVGRLGGATPMARVKPVEVNETTVTDVSLGSCDRFNKLDLFEGQEVIIYSAGDVIPQLKPSPHSNNTWDAPYLKLKKICPYCGEKLTRISTEYCCANPNCVRVNAGRISNFASKMGIQGFSDKSFEDFYSAGIVTSIVDLFYLTPEQITMIDGYEKKSAENFVNEITRISRIPTQLSTFFGALGIPNISKKKCQKIFEYVTFQDVLRRDSSELMLRIVDAHGVGAPTAKIFIKFVKDNKKMLKQLAGILNIVEDVKAKGSIVFSGFRNSEWADKFAAIGYENGDSVTNNTIAVISASEDTSSSKCKAASKKGIPIYSYGDIDLIYDKLKAGRRL